MVNSVLTRSTQATLPRSQSPSMQQAAPANGQSQSSGVPGPAGQSQGSGQTQNDEIDAFAIGMITAAFGPVPGLQAAALRSAIGTTLRTAIGLCAPANSNAVSVLRSAFSIPTSTTVADAGRMLMDWVVGYLPSGMLNPPQPPSSSTAPQDPPDPPVQKVTADTTHQQLWTSIGTAASVAFLTPANIVNVIQKTISDWAAAIQSDAGAVLPNVGKAINDAQAELTTDLPRRTEYGSTITVAGFLAQRLPITTSSTSIGNTVHAKLQAFYHEAFSSNTVVEDGRVYRKSQSAAPVTDAAGYTCELLSDAQKADRRKTPPDYTLNALSTAHALFIPGMKRLSYFRDDVVDLTRAMTWEIKPMTQVVPAIYEEFYYRQSYNIAAAIYTDLSNLAVAPLALQGGTWWQEGRQIGNPIFTQGVVAFPVYFQKLPGVVTYVTLNIPVGAAVAALALALKSALDELAKLAKDTAQRLRKVDVLTWLCGALHVLVLVVFCYLAMAAMAPQPSGASMIMAPATSAPQGGYNWRRRSSATP